jgi:hypothetical protein
MSHTAEWTPLNSRFYRKVEVYDMQWQQHMAATSNDKRNNNSAAAAASSDDDDDDDAVVTSLDGHMTAVAANGGPIAMLPASSTAAGINSMMAMRMRVFTSAGRRIHSFRWQYRNVVALGFSHDEKIVAVLSDGAVHMFTIFGERCASFTLGAAAAADGVADCVIWPR